MSVSVLPGWQLPTKGAYSGGLDLLDVENVPSYQKAPFIMRGYRPMPQGLWSLLRTVFTLHNETGNMWTHLVGSVYFLIVGVQLVLELVQYQEQLLLQEAMCVLVLIIATDFCLVSSFTYHLCRCGSQGVCNCTHKLDQTGIAALISTSYGAGIALGYRCFPVLRRFYLTYAALVALLLTAPLLQPRLVANMTRHFIVCVAMGVVPAVHWVCISSIEDIIRIIPYLLAMFGCYATGACFFVWQWPERRWPGRFDLVGHSHQLWHIFVVLAALSWVKGCLVMLERAGTVQC